MKGNPCHETWPDARLESLGATRGGKTQGLKCGPFTVITKTKGKGKKHMGVITKPARHRPAACFGLTPGGT